MKNKYGTKCKLTIAKNNKQTCKPIWHVCIHVQTLNLLQPNSGLYVHRTMSYKVNIICQQLQCQTTWKCDHLSSGEISAELKMKSYWHICGKRTWIPNAEYSRYSLNIRYACHMGRYFYTIRSWLVKNCGTHDATWTSTQMHSQLNKQKSKQYLLPWLQIILGNIYIFHCYYFTQSNLIALLIPCTISFSSNSFFSSVSSRCSSSSSRFTFSLPDTVYGTSSLHILVMT